ncbi:MAG: hypothetical protein HY717_00600 [Planctomycetes bacterium]|nr:hypothetical protein [Planctomycetota bacterium]
MDDAKNILESRPVESSGLRPAQAGNPYLFLFGGLAVGALLAAACGLDLYPPSRQLQASSAQALAAQRDAAMHQKAQLEESLRLKDEELRRARSRAEESGRLAEGLKARLAPLEEEFDGFPLPGVQALLDLCGRGEWGRAARSAHALLKGGEAGLQTLVRALPEFIREHVDDLLASEALFAFLRLAVASEKEVADFISAALAAPEVWEDPAVAERALRWSCQFLIGCRGDYTETRSVLMQSLDKAFAEGQIGLWAVLHCYDSLRVKVPVDSIQRLLDNPQREKDHGVLLKHLGQRADAEAISVLRLAVQSAKGPESWKASLALELLGDLKGEAAEEAVLEFVNARALEIREPAYLAYFSQKRDPGAGLQVVQELINSSVPEATKRRVLDRVLLKNREVFKALDPEHIADPRLRDELRAAIQAFSAAPGKPGR